MAEGDALGTEATGASVGDGARQSVASRPPAPTLPQWDLGRYLRSRRQDCDLSAEGVAKELQCAPSRIRQLEAAEIRPTEAELNSLRQLFKLDDDEDLDRLIREAGLPGWWAKFRDLGVPYIGLEQHASSITSYTTQYLPALVQTAEYARAIILVIAPQIDPSILEERVEARLQRQHILSAATAPRYEVLLDEAVLRRPIGGRTVMYEQLGHVLAMSQAKQVNLRVVPIGNGVRVAQDSNFVRLQFERPDLLPVVYIEGLVASPLLVEKEDTDRYAEEIERLEKLALDSSESAELVTRARDSYRDG